jgi:hypothetical protein
MHDWWQSDVDVQLSLQWLKSDSKLLDMNIDNPTPHLSMYQSGAGICFYW